MRPGIAYRRVRSTTRAFVGTPDVPLPTDFTRSPSTTTTGSVMTLLPSHSFPKRRTATSDGPGAPPVGACPATAPIDGSIAATIAANSCFRMAMVPSEDVLHTDLQLPGRPGVRLKDAREVPRVEI